MSFSKKKFVQIDADFNFEEPDLANDNGDRWFLDNGKLFKRVSLFVCDDCGCGAKSVELFKRSDYNFVDCDCKCHNEVTK